MLAALAQMRKVKRRMSSFLSFSWLGCSLNELGKFPWD